MILFSIQLWSINRWLRWTGFRIGIFVDVVHGMKMAHDHRGLEGRKPSEICLTWYGFKGWREWGGPIPWLRNRWASLRDWIRRPPYRSRFDHYGPPVFVLVAAALVGWGVWFSVAHPCVRWEPRKCGTDLIPVVCGDNCVIYIPVDETPPCTQCAERAP